MAARPPSCHARPPASGLARHPGRTPGTALAPLPGPRIDPVGACPGRPSLGQVGSRDHRPPRSQTTVRIMSCSTACGGSRTSPGHATGAALAPLDGPVACPGRVTAGRTGQAKGKLSTVGSPARVRSAWPGPAPLPGPGRLPSRSRPARVGLPSCQDKNRLLPSSTACGGSRTSSMRMLDDTVTLLRSPGRTQSEFLLGWWQGSAGDSYSGTSWSVEPIGPRSSGQAR